MASIFNQDIGFNYKGIITLGSTINQNLSGTLQYLTDGDGNNLPIQISTTGLQFNAIETIYRNAAGTNIAMNVWGNLGRVAIGGLATNYTPSASLHVRGDGTNPTGRFEAADGTAILTIPALAANTSTLTFRGFYLAFANNTSQLIGIENGTFLFFSGGNRFTISSTGVVTLYNAITTTLQTFTLGTGAALSTINAPRYAFTPTGNVTTISGTSQGIAYTDTFAAAAGSALYRPLSLAYTINNTGAQTGNTTGIFLNATETALNGMTHNLMDLQVGGVSRFNLLSSGFFRLGPSAANSINFDANGFLYINASTNRFYVSNTGLIYGYNELRNTGNMFVGSIAVTPTARLHVRGDGTNPIARFEDNAGVNSFGIGNNRVVNIFGNSGTTATASIETGPVNIWNTTSSPRHINFLSGNNTGTGAYIGVNSFNTLVLGDWPVLVNSSLTVSGAFSCTFQNSTGNGIPITGTGTATSSTARVINSSVSFAPTSGTGDWAVFASSGTINQTGGANGITRGLYVNPTLTAAADFRAVEVKAGSTSAHKLMLLTNAAGNKVIEVNAAQEIGFFNTTPVDQQEVTGSRSNPEDALAKLLIALASYGIIIDSTTA